MKKGTPKSTRVKKPGDWFCPQCFVQNSLEDERCSNCVAEKDEETAYVVLSASSKELGAKEEQSALRASSNSLKKVAPPSPELNVSHYCEWGWFYCDGLICQDPEYNRTADIMADLVQVETFDVVLDVPDIILYDQQWEGVLEGQLTELGMWPQPFVNDEIANPVSFLSPRQKRQKKKEVELKKIGDILERYDSQPKPPLSLSAKKPKKKTPSGPRLNTRTTYSEDESSENDSDVLSFSDEEEIQAFGHQTDDGKPLVTSSDQNQDLDFQVALSLQWSSDNISQPISKSTEIASPTVWPTLSTSASKRQGSTSPWPSLSPATPGSKTTSPRGASPWPAIGTPATSTPVSPAPKPASKWGAQSLAAKIGSTATTPGTTPGATTPGAPTPGATTPGAPTS